MIRRFMGGVDRFRPHSTGPNGVVKCHIHEATSTNASPPGPVSLIVTPRVMPSFGLQSIETLR